MSVVPLELAKLHLRVVSGEEDEAVQLYIDAAEERATQLLQRGIYVDAGALTGARTTAPGALENSLAAIAVDREAAMVVEDCDVRCALLADLDARRADALSAFRYAMRGIVANEAIRSAILLTTGHLFEHREEIVAEQGVMVAIDMPVAARTLLQPYRVGLGV